jgi:hypothetical protein
VAHPARHVARGVRFFHGAQNGFIFFAAQARDG